MATEVSGDYSIPATDELIEIVNSKRKGYGYTDLVGSEYDNDVYYNFYLIFNPKENFISIEATCNHGENDDFVAYTIRLSPEEKEMLMFKVIEDLAKGGD